MTRDPKMNTRKCEICNVHILRTTFAKHLRSKKHVKIKKQNEMTIPEIFFQEPIENKF